MKHVLAAISSKEEDKDENQRDKENCSNIFGVYGRKRPDPACGSHDSGGTHQRSFLCDPVSALSSDRGKGVENPPCDRKEGGAG